MKIIVLANKKIVFLDAEDYENLKNFKWSYHSQGYAFTRTSRKLGKRKHILMHRMIMNVNDSTQEVDHINGNRLDNRKVNLRIVTRSENGRNQLPQKRNKSSKYKGVSFYKPTKKWRASIKFNKKSYNLGYFVSEIDAALEYNKKAKELFGEYAKLNEISK